jgi:CRISPR type I-E-associated protein CasB/Cse2
MSEQPDALTALCQQITHPRADTGLLARLRRGNPDADGSRDAMFETQALLLAAKLDPFPEQLPSWALLIHCLALTRGRHRSGAPTGQVLAEINYGELRMRMLMEADEPLLRDLLPRLARRIATTGREIDWWPFANLLGLGKASPDEARQRLIHSFLRASHNQ